MKCSVVILNWNGEQTLRQFLPSVLKYTQLPDVEVVVADNGSTDGSIDYLRTQDVRIITCRCRIHRIAQFGCRSDRSLARCYA